MKIPDWTYKLLFDKKYKVIKHIFFWFFIYADETLSLFGLTSPFEQNYSTILLELIADMVMVYINIYYLLPRFFLKGKFMEYFVLTFLLVVLVILFNNFIYGINFSDPEVEGLSVFLFDIPINVSLLFMAVAMKLISHTYKSNTQIMELREDKLETELAYLKTQVNPHFLFNTLNNIYVMSKKKDDQVPETIMQLSELLRYQLYECNVDTVPLKNEVAYLKNYIQLEQIRRQSLHVAFDIKVPNMHQPIRPLIFLPFIENAFKYSNSNSGTDKIDILLEKQEEKLIFSCKNNKGTLHSGVSGGIGLVNATRRLELSYPDSHTLDIRDEEKDFTVHVEITLP